MEFFDRVSAYPNRYLMTFEDGSARYVVLERADEPITVGTPLNAETLNPIAEEVEKLRTEVDAMKGVDIGVRPNDRRCAYDPRQFDYFLLYETESDLAPAVFNVIFRDDERMVVEAECLYRVADLQSARQTPRGLFEFEVSDDEWELYYTSELESGSAVSSSFYRVYGFKYPILGVE